MRIIFLFIVIIQLKGYEQFPRSFPVTYEQRQNGYTQPQAYQTFNSHQSNRGYTDGNVPQNHYGPMQQIDPFNTYTDPGQTFRPSMSTFEDGAPRQAFPRSNVVYLPPSQPNGQYRTQIKLPQNIGGYQLVHNGETPESDYNQGTNSQLNRQQMPQNIQGNSPFLHIPNPAQNDYQIAPNYHTKSPYLHISPSYGQNQEQLQLSQNFHEQNHFQNQQNFNGNPPLLYAPYRPENTYQLPQRNFPAESLAPPPSNIYPFDASSSGDFNSQMTNVPHFSQKVPHFSQNVPQHLPQNNIQDVPQDVQQYSTQNGPYQPPNLDYGNHQYTPNHNSQSIPPYVPQYNDPKNGQYTLNRSPAYVDHHYRKRSEDVEEAGSTVTQAQHGNFQEAQEQEESQNRVHRHSQPNRVQLNKEGYRVFNEFTEHQRDMYAHRHQSQLQYGQINEEGYQIVNEAPVDHFVSIGTPSTEIITPQRLQENSGSENSMKPLQHFRTEIPKNYDNDQANIEDDIGLDNRQHLQQAKATSDITQNKQAELSEDVPKSQESENNQIPAKDGDVGKGSPRYQRFIQTSEYRRE